MNQFFLALLLVVSGLCWWLWQDNQALRQNNATLEVAVQTQEETISTLQNDFALQTSQLNELALKNQETQKEMNRYLDIFKRHNLNKLAIAKPGLLETKVNRGTKDVFDTIENDSRELDSLDDPAGDINPNN